jgi:hypothetical protein
LLIRLLDFELELELELELEIELEMWSFAVAVGQRVPSMARSESDKWERGEGDTREEVQASFEARPGSPRRTEGDQDELEDEEVGEEEEVVVVVNGWRETVMLPGRQLNKQ